MSANLSTNIWRAWRALGIPVAVEPLEESADGIIDPEALIVLTLLFEHDPRILTDVGVWLTENEDLLIAQKLGAIMARTGTVAAPPSHPFRTIPAKLRKALNVPSLQRKTAVPSPRRHKLAPRSAMANSSRAVFNRLYHGVSARADIITALEIAGFNPSGAELAALLAIDASTVSRVKTDLRDCGVLGSRGLQTDARRLPGYFLSAATVSHQLALADASNVKDPALRRAMLPELDERVDGLSAAMGGTAHRAAGIPRSRYRARKSLRQ